MKLNLRLAVTNLFLILAVMPLSPAISSSNSLLQQCVNLEMPTGIRCWSSFGANPQRFKTRLGSVSVKELFHNNCARCHAADGSGNTPLGQTYKVPNFREPDWWKTHPELKLRSRLVTIVSRGKGGMPAFEKKLAHGEITRLVDYVRKFKNQQRSKSD